MHTFWSWSLHLIYVQGSKLASFILGICPIFYCSKQGEGNFNKRQNTKKSDRIKKAHTGRIKVEREERDSLRWSQRSQKGKSFNGTELCCHKMIYTQMHGCFHPNPSIHYLMRQVCLSLDPHCAFMRDPIKSRAQNIKKCNLIYPCIKDFN